MTNTNKNRLPELLAPAGTPQAAAAAIAALRSSCAETAEVIGLLPENVALLLAGQEAAVPDLVGVDTGLGGEGVGNL